jgi:hypothetical protein
MLRNSVVADGIFHVSRLHAKQREVGTPPFSNGDNVENKNQSPSTLIVKHWTKTPNWVFDELLKCGEPALVCVVLFLIRQFVGWQHRTEINITQSELSKETGLCPKAASRWLNVVAALGWIEYERAKNGGGESTVRFVRLPERAVEIRILAAAIRWVAFHEKNWARKETHVRRSDKNSYIEWVKRPRLTNADYCQNINIALTHLRECSGCDDCRVVPEVIALADSVKRPK